MIVAIMLVIGIGYAIVVSLDASAVRETIDVVIVDKYIVGDVNGKAYFIDTDIGTYRVGWSVYSQVVVGKTYTINLKNGNFIHVVTEVR
ncbi:hypothetical protein [Bacteroides sp.]|uniref:hypothetical protein n=1 Tax=Bacteroides sp. TaxID=29523 RepID=UPI002603CA4A|nr:hypothetical protein [Bacteroides sp.]MDD3039039.1 hypothetical protein [Bacteroides sp.]